MLPGASPSASSSSSAASVADAVARRNRNFLLLAGAIIVLLLIYLMRLPEPDRVSSHTAVYRYPYQSNYHHYSSASTHYRFMVISDMDKASRGEKAGKPFWQSKARIGELVRDPATGTYTVKWVDERTYALSFNDGARGMELSDLCNFNGKLYSFDDRTGLVVDVLEDRVVPAAILTDGDGKVSKGFKGEWCTVMGDHLYIGGMGKEWTNQQGKTEGYDPQWVKTIDRAGVVTHINWVNQYETLREATGTKYPGYLLHEAVAFNPVTRKWLFFPRRVSKEPYEETLDETRGSNRLLIASEDFSEVQVFTNIGPLNPNYGFSAVKFVPFRENEFVLLKTTEVDNVNTVMTVIDIHGRVLMSEIDVGNVKFEGIEFL